MLRTSINHFAGCSKVKMIYRDAKVVPQIRAAITMLPIRLEQKAEETMRQELTKFEQSTRLVTQMNRAWIDVGHVSTDKKGNFLRCSYDENALIPTIEMRLYGLLEQHKSPRKSF